ncbi:cystatin-like protein [Pangasianodon hypophthalmus]|uniref:cystatin-like protein n=1 Tax=Pangasianodon hypophthalmus TaxID=310915 RepID=UPI002307652B|nr:cystatin-like protein [Pangasianodon hypophthalmus]
MDGCCNIRHDLKSANSHSSVVNMDGALKVLLLAALILLVSAQTFNNYRSLPDVLKKHIDKALKKANQHFGAGHHVAYEKLRKTPTTMESSLNVNVLLKVTTCKKASKDAYQHRDECVTQKERTPLIDCLVCKTTDGTELVDCGRLREVITGLRSEIRNKCSVYHTGGSTIMMQKEVFEDNEKHGGCLGCM